MPKAEHLIPIFITNFRVLLFGSNYYIYDYTKFDLVKNEDGSAMTAFWQAKAVFNEGLIALEHHCHKLIQNDYKRQVAEFEKKKLNIAMLQAKNSGHQSLSKEN
jgi:hypothetical protein